MNSDQKDLLKIGADAAIKPFASLIERLFGGLVDETGGQWKDAAQVRRFQRRLKLYARVQQMIATSGIDPYEVNDRQQDQQAPSLALSGTRAEPTIQPKEQPARPGFGAHEYVS